MKLDEYLVCFYVPASNDMSHFIPSYYSYSDYFYVTEEFHEKMLKFTDPELMNPPKDLVAAMVRHVGLDNMGKSGWLDKVNETDIGKRMDAAIKLNPQRSLLWQFNALASNKKDTIRQVCALGERRFVPWSLFDVHVLLPYYKAKSNCMNYLNRAKAEQEQVEWDKFVTKVHEDIKNKE